MLAGARIHVVAAGGDPRARAASPVASGDTPMTSMPSPAQVDEDRPMVYRYAQASDRGLVREQNEDAVAVAE